MPLRTVPDDQRLAVLDMFLAVIHQQPVSDPLILDFFGFGGGIYGNALGITMRQAVGILAVKFYLN